MTPETVAHAVGLIVSGVGAVGLAVMGLIFRRLGAALELLQSLDKRVALIEQRMDAADDRMLAIEVRLSETESDVDVIRLDHARNHAPGALLTPVRSRSTK